MIDPQALPWQTLATAPYIHYALARDAVGQDWIYFACDACEDVSKRPCVAPRERGSHWIAQYAVVHTH